MCNININLTKRQRLYLYTSTFIVCLITFITVCTLSVGTKSRSLKNNTFDPNLKYILLWTDADIYPFDVINKENAFTKYNCSYTNCIVTDDRDYFDGNLTNFHAIAFNGRNLPKYKSYVPSQRSPEQKYIYFNTESADNYPVCDEMYDGFFNMTSTYRMDSDVPFPYIAITDSDNEVIGPKNGINWLKTSVDERFYEKLKNKTKAVAWFVSNCKSKNKRESFAKDLDKALKMYDLNIDIYGACGTLSCPRKDADICFKALEKDYRFYLSFENSMNVDYVTEKLLTALLHDTVPIVYGGADYSKFLPPDSYIDATKHSPSEVAALIARYMSSTKLYSQFFQWRPHYKYHDPMRENVCRVCSAVNNQEYNDQSQYEEFRSWWNPSFKTLCGL